MVWRATQVGCCRGDLENSPEKAMQTSLCRSHADTRPLLPEAKPPPTLRLWPWHSPPW